MQYGDFFSTHGLLLTLFSMAGLYILVGAERFPAAARISFFVFYSALALVAYFRWREQLLRSTTPEEPTSVPSDWSANSERLVRDPVCGVDLAAGAALPLKRSTETVHFCSVRCREEYLQREQDAWRDVTT